MRILLVDDEAIQRQFLAHQIKDVMEDAGSLELRQASNGQKCMAELETWQPDMLFLDLRMPVMDGLEVLRRLKGREAPRVVVLTAFDDFSYAQEAIESGAAAYLLKPADKAEIKRVIDENWDYLSRQRQKSAEREELIERLSQSRPYIEQEYINEIISGLRVPAAARRERERILGLREAPSWCILLTAEVPRGLEEAQRQMALTALHDRVRQALNSDSHISGRLGRGRIVCFVAPVETSTPAAQEDYVRRFLRRVVQGRSTALRVGVSRVHRNPEEVYRSFQEAQQALEFALASGGPQPVFLADVMQESAPPGEHDPTLDRDLAEAVRLGDAKRTASLLSSVAEEIKKTAITDSGGFCLRAVEVLTLLCRSAILGGSLGEEVWSRGQGVLSEILRCHDSGEASALLISLGEQLVNMQSDQRRTRSKVLMQKAVQFVRDNYSGPMTVEDAARQVYLSPYYFSHLFKQETGRSFVSFLTEVRIMKASELLRTTVISVGVIGERVGYSDVNYFSRVFKKQMGITPTQYRERHFAAP